MKGMPAWSPDGQTIAYVGRCGQYAAGSYATAIGVGVLRKSRRLRTTAAIRSGRRTANVLYFISLARERESLWSVAPPAALRQVVIET
jgi:Tol biopolymer transport system component